MAKKAPLLGSDYNPVGSRLRGILSQDPDPAASSTTESAGEPPAVPTGGPTDFAESQHRRQPRTFANKALDTRLPREAMTYELRCRCTQSERRRWHEFAQRVTGEPNRFSNFFRAMLLLLERADPQLEKMHPLLEQLGTPPKSDGMAMALYEQRLAEIIWEALRRGGKPSF